MNDMTDVNLMKNECIENLMLISAFGETSLPPPGTQGTSAPAIDQRIGADVR